MAYIVDQAQTGGTAAITAIAMNMPAHQTDDILVAHITVDSGTVTLGGSAFAALPSAPANPITQGIISYLFYFKATGGAETLTLTTADAYTCGVYCFRDVDPTTPFDGVTPLHAGVATATTTPVNSTITTGTNDALVVYLLSQDGTTPQVLTDPGVMSIYNADSTGTSATTSAHGSAAWYIQRTAGATPVANWSSSVSGVYVRATFALRNKSGGRIPAYVDDVTSPGTRLTAGHHIATQSNISYSASGSFVIVANIGAKVLTQAAAVNGADFGINPYANAVTSAAAATAVANLTGPELVLTGGRNLSTGLIVGSVIAGTPKQGLFGIGSISQGGVVVRVASGANNWNAYQISSKDAVVTPESRCVFAIQAGYDGSDYAVGSSGNALNTAITYIQMLRNAPSFSSQTYFSEIHQAQAHVVAGGDATTPVDANGLVEIGRSFRIPLIQKAGPNGVVSFVPIQIGGGDAVNFQIDSGSIQFPRRADTTKKDIQFHAADNVVGYKDAGKSGDIVKLTNSTVSSPTPFHFEITAGATNLATRDYTGLSIVGGTVLLRNVMTFDQINFTSCPTIDISGCTLSNCKITKVATGNSTLTTNGTTAVSNTSINVSQVLSGNYYASVASPSIFTNCSFTGGGGHAIRITAPGTYTLTGNIFTGFGVGGSNGAAIFNDSGGAVTLNITGGGSTPTVRNGVGASTTVNNSVSVTLTAQTDTGAVISGANVHVYATSGSGTLPVNASITIVNLVAVATVTHTGHGISTGDKVWIKGASHNANNGVFIITVIDANTYTYTMGSTPGSNPTGAITSTFVVLNGTTNVSGQITMSRGFPANQTFTGWARKSTSSPLYKQGSVNGTISTTLGANVTATLISDE